MTGLIEPSPASTDIESSESVDQGRGHEKEGRADEAVEWMYRRIGPGRWKFPYYASPQVQLALVAVLCFLCPGMLNALSGLGGGGQISAHDANDAAVAHYSTSAGLGFFAGSVVNRIGIRIALCIGGLGYGVYIAAFLSYSHNQNAGFLIFVGGISRFCSGVLWAAQGVVMMSYPPERLKGRYIS